MTRLWPSLLGLSRVVQPDTILRWHRAGFRAYWHWKSRRRAGRPRVSRELRELIVRMSKENLLWGAPRVHGELLKLGFEIAKSTVSKYMIRRRGPPSQTWRTFLRNMRKAALRMSHWVTSDASDDHSNSDRHGECDGGWQPNERRCARSHSQHHRCDSGQHDDQDQRHWRRLHKYQRRHSGYGGLGRYDWDVAAVLLRATRKLAGHIGNAG